MKSATSKLIMTAKGQVSLNIISMLRNCRFDEKSKKIYTGYNSGRGRFISANSAQSTVLNILNAEKLKYTIGNDAPRGGITGEFVKVSKTAFDLILNIKNSN